jgi:anti-sigma B factor antagonist
MSLAIETRSIGDITVLRCTGRIVEGDESRALASTVDTLLRLQPYVVLDLRGVSYVDSAGVGLLLRLRWRAQNAAGDLKICAASPRVREVLRVTKLDGALRPHESDEDAIAAFYSRTDSRQDRSLLAVDVAFVHPSADVLAYGSELLKRAGYGVATASNASDASVLVRATRPTVVVITPDLHARLIDLRRDVLAKTQVLLLAADFSHEDPGDSSRELLDDLGRAFDRDRP